MSDLTCEKVIELFTPKDSNRVIKALMLLSLATDRAAAVMNPTEQISIAQGMDLFDTTPSEDWVEDSIKGLAKDDPIKALVIVQHGWAFSPSVDDAEIEVWDQDVSKHPDAIRIFDVAAITRELRQVWVVSYNLLHVPPLLEMTGVFGEPATKVLDNRFLPFGPSVLPNVIRKKGGTKGKKVIVMPRANC